MSSLLTALRSSNPIPCSAAFWLLKGLSCVTLLPLTHSLPLFLFSALSPLMMKHSKADNLGSLFSLRSFLASASRFSPAIVNKLALAQGETFSKKNCSNDYHTKTSASLASLTRFSLMNLLPSSAPPSRIVPTIKTFALISPHLHCNLLPLLPHILFPKFTSPKLSMMPKVFNPIPFLIPKVSYCTLSSPTP